MKEGSEEKAKGGGVNGNELSESFVLSRDKDLGEKFIKRVVKRIFQDSNIRTAGVLLDFSQENVGELLIRTKSPALQLCPVTGVQLHPCQNLRDLLIFSSSKDIAQTEESFNSCVRIMLSQDSSMKIQALKFLSDNRFHFKNRWKTLPNLVWPVCEASAVMLTKYSDLVTRENAMAFILSLGLDPAFDNIEVDITRLLIPVVDSVQLGTIDSIETALVILSCLARRSEKLNLTIGKSVAMQTVIDVLCDDRLGHHACVVLHDLLKMKENRTKALGSNLRDVICRGAVSVQLDHFEDMYPSALALLTTDLEGANQLIINDGFDRFLTAMELRSSVDVWGFCLLTVKHIWFRCALAPYNFSLPKKRIKDLVSKIATEGHGEYRKDAYNLRMLLN